MIVHPQNYIGPLAPIKIISGRTRNTLGYKIYDDHELKADDSEDVQQ